MARLRVQITAILATTVLLLAACGGDDAPTAGEDNEDTGSGGAATLEVSAVDNSFEPASLSAAAGEEVTVEVTNDGENPHTFTIDDLEVDTSTIQPGVSATATFTMPETAVTFYCAIHGQRMSGTIDPS